MLLDTNIVIYAANPSYPDLLELVGDPSSAVSLVSYLEALGYSRLGPTERITLDGSSMPWKSSRFRIWSPVKRFGFDSSGRWRWVTALSPERR